MWTARSRASAIITRRCSSRSTWKRSGFASYTVRPSSERISSAGTSVAPGAKNFSTSSSAASAVSNAVANGDVRHHAQVIGAASRVLPDVFTPARVRQLVEIDLREAPPESGNVAVGFMSTAIQGAEITGHRDRVANILQAAPADAARQSTPRSRTSRPLTR